VSPRQALAAVLSTLLLGGLAVKALQPDVPVSASLSLARKHWSSNRTTRVLNSPLFVRDRDFGLTLLEADRRIPLEKDAVLYVPPGTDAQEAEMRRRKAAFILSPRRVMLVVRPLPEGKTFGIGPAR
jgi:hypothetical protein